MKICLFFSLAWLNIAFFPLNVMNTCSILHEGSCMNFPWFNFAFLFTRVIYHGGEDASWIHHDLMFIPLLSLPFPSVLLSVCHVQVTGRWTVGIAGGGEHSTVMNPLTWCRRMRYESRARRERFPVLYLHDPIPFKWQRVGLAYVHLYVLFFVTFATW